VHEVGGELRLRASVYSGFRAGTPSELFVDSLGRNIVLSNPTLAPEKLRGAEAGVDLTPSRRASTRLTGYWSRAEDLIERFVLGRAGPAGAFIEPCGQVQPNGNCAQRRNLGEVRVLGIEVEQTVDLDAHWRLHLAGTLLDTEVTSSPGTPGLVGNRTIRTPNEAINLNLRYSHPRFLQGELHASWIGQRWDDPENEDLLPEQFLVHASVARGLGRRWTASAGVQNLFDEREIVDFSGSLAQLGAPRTAYVGVSFRSR
jgi:iron complex outermembrane receptor protein